MITKIGKKEQYVPYATDGKTSVVMWDYSPIKNEGEENEIGKWVMETIKYPTIEKVKDVILNYYNRKIDDKILKGMVWKGMNVWLSSENQFNYKTAYDITVESKGMNLPVVFKFGDANTPVYYEFKTVEELREFYLSSVQYVQNTLSEGWKIKDNINWEIYK